MSFVLILVSAMFLGDVLWWRWAYAALRPIPHARRWRLALNAFMLTQMICVTLFIVGRVGPYRVDSTLPRFLVIATFLWHFILLAVGVVLALVDLTARAGAKLLRRSTARPSQELLLPESIEASPEAFAPAMSRRDLLRAAAVVVPPVATGMVTGFSLQQLSDFRTRSFDLKLNQLPEPLEGLRILQVTDLHVGPFTSDRMLRKVIDASNALRPDLILMTGDLINRALSDLPAGLDLVRRLDARFGIFMIEGNHDLMESRPKFEQVVRGGGIPLLANESTILKIRGADLQLLGLRWGGSGRGGGGNPNDPSQRGDKAIDDSMDVLLPQLQPGAFPILMAHHPHAFDRAAAAGIPLTLAGHTHGGQVMLGPQTGFGPLMFRYWSGLYEKARSKLIVSNGVGNWFPLRINAPAEIVQITLHRA